MMDRRQTKNGKNREKANKHTVHTSSPQAPAHTCSLHERRLHMPGVLSGTWSLRQPLLFITEVSSRFGETESVFFVLEVAGKDIKMTVWVGGCLCVCVCGMEETTEIE